jgi:hypothetical protein
MPSPQRVQSFVETVTSGDYVGAIERFYTPKASMRENIAPARLGRDGLVAWERGVMAAFASIEAELVSPPAVTGDRVAVHWRFRFKPADGPERTLEEIAWQRWEGDLIAEEVFFYDPAQIAGLER